MREGSERGRNRDRGLFILKRGDIVVEIKGGYRRAILTSTYCNYYFFQEINVSYIRF